MASKCVAQRHSRRAIDKITRNRLAMFQTSKTESLMNPSNISARDFTSMQRLSHEQQQSHHKYDRWKMVSLTTALAATSILALEDKREDATKKKINNSIAKCDGSFKIAPDRKGSMKHNKQSEVRRNVMLHRMRSIQARNLDEKYNVDWKNVLGEGAYGSVHPARLSATGQKVALKKICKRHTSSSSFKTETNALLRIYDNGGHPNISGLRDMYEDYSYFYLILDLVSGGEMFEHLIEYGAYSEADAARLMQEVSSALAFLHGVGVIHADLKPENLLLCSKKKSDGTIKIVDFGCAVVTKDNEQDDYHIEELSDLSETRAKRESTGTTAYWSPERFNKGYIPDAKSDLWSVGIILFIMLCGVHPFDLTGTSTDEEIAERIKKDPRPPIGKITQHLSPSAVDLIKKLMTKDPKERMTAEDMLCHPWITGETASKSKMIDSDKKLSGFKELRQKLEAGIFAVLVNHGNNQNDNTEATGDIMKRAFEVFDAGGKGFVSSDDLERVVGQLTNSQLSSSDSEDMVIATLESGDSTNDTRGNAPTLSLSDFSKLFSRLKHQHYPRGHIIFHAGDEGDAMYFINAGKVEIKTRKGQLISILRSGDFFGEGSLLNEEAVRFSMAKCATPVDAIKISREEFDRYIASSTSAKKNLKLKWYSRQLKNAKSLIRLQRNVKARIFHKGDYVYREGDVGKSMFMVDEIDGGTLEVSHDDVFVHSYHNGDSFGESSLLFTKPRSSTVKCVSDTCKLHEMQGADFLALLESSPESAASFRDMCRKRIFKKAVKKINLEKRRGFGMDDLVEAFREADINNSGTLDLEEVRSIMHRLDPDFPESEIVALLKFIDIDEDGGCDLEEFKRIFRVFENM